MKTDPTRGLTLIGESLDFDVIPPATAEVVEPSEAHFRAKDAITLLDLWHLGRRTVDIPISGGASISVGMALELRIRDRLAGRLDPEVLSEALRQLRKAELVPPRTPASLLLVEAHPSVLEVLLHRAYKVLGR